MFQLLSGCNGARTADGHSSDSQLSNQPGTAAVARASGEPSSAYRGQGLSLIDSSV